MNVKDVVCVHLDIKFFKPNPKTMRDLHNFSRPVCAAQALSVFSHIVSNPELSHASYTPGGKENERAGYYFSSEGDMRTWSRRSTGSGSGSDRLCGLPILDPCAIQRSSFRAVWSHVGAE